MVRLKQLEACMKPQFIWDKSSAKILQTSETYEGAKDLGRMIFVGIADMHGFDQASVQDYLDMSYDSHRNKIQQFRANLREANRRVKEGTVYMIDDPIKKFYMKLCLTLNSIKFNYRQNSYLKLTQYD
jgi:predicted transcriptional regulator